MTVISETPVGRIVWGHPMRPQIKKDQTTKQPVLKDGQQVNQWAFGVAIPKQEFGSIIWPVMDMERQMIYPNGAPPKFAWKYQDGDGIDSNGKPFNTREGYAGCYVLTVSTEAFQPPVFKWNGQRYEDVPPEGIKCGDYVVLNIDIKGHIPKSQTHTPGLYVNPNGIMLVGYGSEIFNGPDAETMFGAAPKQYQLPPGASLTPVASNGGVAMPGMPGQQPQMGMPGQQPQMGMPGQQPQMGMPGQQPQMGMPGQQPQYQPAHDFVQNATGQMPGNR
jgi:hypothetical protein